jgi:putative MFS transporter
MSRRYETDSDAESGGLCPLHFFALFVCALGLGLDLAELVIGSTLSALFSAAPNALEPHTLSWLLAAPYIGLVVGAPVAGWYADAYGRRATMLIITFILTFTSMAAAFSPNVAMLIVARGLSGLALGAYPPVIAAYLTDILPAAHRGRSIMVTVAAATLAPSALIFLVRWLTPLQPLGLESWRWAFIVGGACSALCLLLSRHLPESPRWLASRNRLAEAGEASVRFGVSAALNMPGSPAGEKQRCNPSALEGRAFARRIGLLLLLYFLTPWSAVAFPLLSGAILIQKGFNVADSLLYVGIANIGPTIGGLMTGLAIDRIERKSALVLCPFALMGLGYLFAITSAPALLMATGLAFSMIGVVFQAILVLYAAELFPATQRAKATSLSWASRGLGSALAPLILLPLLSASGPSSMFFVIGGTLATFTVILWLFGPRGKAGRKVQ